MAQYLSDNTNNPNIPIYPSLSKIGTLSYSQLYPCDTPEYHLLQTQNSFTAKENMDLLLFLLKGTEWKDIDTLTNTTQINSYLSNSIDLINSLENFHIVLLSIRKNKLICVKLKNELIKYLITKGVKDDKYYVAFREIIKRTKKQILKRDQWNDVTELITLMSNFIISKKIHPDFITKYGNALHIIANLDNKNSYCRLTIENHIRNLMNMGVDINQLNDKEETPIIIASHSNNLHIIKLFVNHSPSNKDTMIKNVDSDENTEFDNTLNFFIASIMLGLWFCVKEVYE
jgi:hypothetical protein